MSDYGQKLREMCDSLRLTRTYLLGDEQNRGYINLQDETDMALLVAWIHEATELICIAVQEVTK